MKKRLTYLQNLNDFGNYRFAFYSINNDSIIDPSMRDRPTEMKPHRKFIKAGRENKLSLVRF